MISLYLQAPFATFRTFTAGSYRPTAGFITPSAAYGLLLNVAGIEMRAENARQPMTTIASGLPQARLAIGAIAFPAIHSIFQQVHNYPVGNTRKEHAPKTKGNKYNIQTARRTFLTDIRAYLCVQAAPELETAIVDGLKGNTNRRYGLPFLGDNSFLLDKLEVVDRLKPAHWFTPVASDVDQPPARITRLTITIDRADMSQTKSALFAPAAQPVEEIPEQAWVEVSY